MKTIAQKVAERFNTPEAEPFTVKVRFMSSGKIQEYVVIEALDDGFVGQPLNRDRAVEMIPYHGLDRVRICEAGDA
jgi:hypothetical protein